jgi:hypothetical protein
MMTLLRRHQDPKVRALSRMQRLWYQDVGTIKYGDYRPASTART